MKSSSRKAGVTDTFGEMSDSTARLAVSLQGSRVTVVGDIDAHTCPTLASGLEPLPGDGDVHLDLAGVGFVDSSGLRVIIATHQHAESAGRRLLIEHPSRSVERILEISGLTGHLHIADPS